MHGHPVHAEIDQILGFDEIRFRLTNLSVPAPACCEVRFQNVAPSDSAIRDVATLVAIEKNLRAVICGFPCPRSHGW